jgi:LmbE family N-acetylglucosaminyl deacetylase
MKIVNCFAHLDDAEIWVGGTLLKHSQRGDEIITVTFSKSEDERIKESKLSHSQLKAELIILPYNILNDADKITSELISFFSQTTPDIVLSHWHNDCHLEHRKIFELCSYAIIKSWIKTSYPRAFFAVDTYNSQGLTGVFQPSHYIDISEVWEEKMKLISNFKSQPIEVWKKMSSLQNSLYGNRVNKKFAEGLLQIPIQGKLTSVEYLQGG